MDVNENAEFDIFDDDTSKKIQAEYDRDLDDAAKAIGARRMGLITGDAEKSTTETWSATGKGLMKKLSSATSLFSRKTPQAPSPSTETATVTSAPSATAPYISPNVQPSSDSLSVPPAVVEEKAAPKSPSPKAPSPTQRQRDQAPEEPASIAADAGKSFPPLPPPSEAAADLVTAVPTTSVASLSTTRQQEKAPEELATVAADLGKEPPPGPGASGAAADSAASAAPAPAPVQAVAAGAAGVAGAATAVETEATADRIDEEGTQPEDSTRAGVEASGDATTTSSRVAATAAAAAAAPEETAAPAPPAIPTAERALPELKVLSFDVREPSLGASVVGHVVVLAGSCYVWAGTEGSSAQGSLAAAVGTRFDGGMPTATPLLAGEGGGGEAGGAAAATGGVSVSMAQRLCRRTGRMVFVSCDLSEDSQILVAAVEAKVVALLKADAS